MFLKPIGTLLLIFPLHFAVAQSELGQTESQTSTRARTAPVNSVQELANKICLADRQSRIDMIRENPRGVTPENVEVIIRSLRSPEKTRNCEQGFLVGHTTYKRAKAQ